MNSNTPIIRPIVPPIKQPWQNVATVTMARMFKVACYLCGGAGNAAHYCSGRALAERALDYDCLGGFSQADVAELWHAKAVDHARRYFKSDSFRDDVKAGRLGYRNPDAVAFERATPMREDCSNHLHFTLTKAGYACNHCGLPA
jgi:hypothetical protein